MGLNSRLTKLENAFHALQQNKHTESPQETASEKHDSTQREPALVAYVPPAPSNTDQSKKPWYKTLNGWRSLLEIIAIPFAIGYAVVTYCSWQDLRHNFMVDQRAWLYVSHSVLSKEPSEEDLGLQVNASVVNSGKTPAVAVGLKYGIFLYDHDPPMADWTKVHMEPQGVLFPSQTNGSFVHDFKLHDASDLAIYKAKTGKIYLRTCLVYTDTFNETHFTESCMYHISGQASDEWTGCNGNTVDGTANLGYSAKTSTCGQ